MKTDPIPVAVVGAGNMGVNHVRVYDDLPGARLVEVVETDPERASSIREEYDVTVHDTVEDLSVAEAASVTVPNDCHRSVAETCIRDGLDVLVEKPLAPTVTDAEAIVAVADEHDAVLQVGHIERFNPAVRTLKTILEDEELIALESHRLGPFNEHLSEVSVVFDLMIHDVDIVDWLVDGDVETLSAVGSRSRSEGVDHAVAQLQYEGDVLGTATASHVTHGKIRTLTATTRDAYIELDYQNQGLKIQRRGIEETTTFDDHGGYRTETVSETPYVRTREPLKNELEHFLECVSTGEDPLVGGAEGVRAIQLTTQIVDSIYGTSSAETSGTDDTSTADSDRQYQRDDQ